MRAWKFIPDYSVADTIKSLEQENYKLQQQNEKLVDMVKECLEDYRQAFGTCYTLEKLSATLPERMQNEQRADSLKIKIERFKALITEIENDR